MTVSIRKAYEDLISPKYDKNKIIAYLVLTIIMGSLIIFLSPQDKISPVLFFLLYLIFTVILSGYFALTTNNEIYGKQSVFPSLTDFQNILIIGLKTLSGTIIISAICFLIPALLVSAGIIMMITSIIAASAVTANMGFFCAVIAIIISAVVLFFIVGYFFYLPLLITYYRTLKFKAFFSLGNANKFRKIRKKYYNSYIWKIFLVGLMLYVISIPVAIIFKMALNIYIGTLSDTQVKILSQTSMSITFCILSTLIGPNLIAQTVGILKKNIPQRSDNA